MTDRIFEIGEAGLESTDQQVRKLMDNLTGSQVPGYRKSGALVRSFPLELEAANMKFSPMKPQVEDSFYSDLQGALIKTGGNLDLALGSDGYFVLYGTWGEGYTRDGRFRLDSEGRMLSVAGNFPVMGQSGPIMVTPGAEVEFTQDGELKVDGVTADRIRVVKPEKQGSLDSLNGTIFKKKDDWSVMQELENPRVIQGYVESSNVNAISSMMEMILLERIYGFDAKIISTRDANLSKAMEMGRATQ